MKGNSIFSVMIKTMMFFIISFMGLGLTIFMFSYLFKHYL